MADSMAFTILAILSARDDAGAVVDRVVGKYVQLDGALKKTAETATTSGAKIDESMLQTASGADALDVATARVEAAQSKLATATEAQAAAEKELLAAQAQVTAGADGDAAAMERQIAAADKLTKAQKDAATASKGLRDAQATQAAISDAQAGKVAEVGKAADSSGVRLSSLASTVGKVGLGLDVAGGLMVKSAADFQSSTTVLQTSGGETASEMDKARQGILNLSSSTGTATQQLTNGLYMLGSAGFDVAHGGLQALQASAQGAKAENASLGTVSNALSTVLTDYNVKLTNTAAGQQTANAYMNQMIAIVQNGKTTTEALAGSLSNVLPVAANVGLSFAQVGGAMATMTAQGESADQASQDLANTIRSLSSPNQVAVKEMQQLGLNATDLSKNLGKVGLAGTIKEITDAIQQHMGPAGTVAVGAFQNSAAAAANAKQMFASLPKNLQALATAYQSGSVSAKEWRKDLQGLDPVSAHLMQQFAGVVDQTHQFNNLLTSGTPAQQTAAQALTKMMGGATGLRTALMLSSNSYKTVTADTQKVAEAGKSAGQSVEGWSVVQSTFNQKMAVAKETMHATGIAIGTALLPAVTGIADAAMKVLKPIAQWVQGHQDLAKWILGSVAAMATMIGAVNLGVKAFNKIEGAVGTVGKVFSKLGGAAETVGGWIGKIPWSSMADGAGKAASAVADFGSQVASAVAQGASTAWDGITSGLSAVAGATRTAAAATLEFSRNLLASAASGLRAAGAWMLEKIQLVATTVAEKAAAAAQWLLNAAMDASPITWIIIAIVALVAAFVYLWTHSQAFRDFWIGLWHDIQGAAEVVWNFLKRAFDDIVQWLKDAWHAIQDATRTVWGWFKAYIMAQVDAVKAILNWFASLPDKFRQWFDDVKNAAVDKLVELGNWLLGLPGRILHWIGDLGSLLYNVGKSILNGLWNGLKDQWNQMTGWIGSIGGWISNLKGPIEVDAVLLTPHGHQIMQGLMKGMRAEMPALQAQLGGITATLQTGVAPAPPTLSATAPALRAPGGGGITIDLRGAVVAGDAGMQQLADRIGRMVATKLGPQAGLKLAAM